MRDPREAMNHRDRIQQDQMDANIDMRRALEGVYNAAYPKPPVQDMVQRVAHALDPVCFSTIADGVVGYEVRRLAALDNARAAIGAMREPSDAMLDCGVAFALQASVHGMDGWSKYIAEKHRTMIDAALAPTISTTKHTQGEG